MTDEDEVRQLAAEFDEVLVGNDATAVASFMTDDWVYSAPTGSGPSPTSSAGSPPAGSLTTP